MHHIKIKNTLLWLFSFSFIILFIGLGFWQLSRAKQKENILKTYAARRAHLPLNANALKTIVDWRFYQVTLEGYFDNAHTILLDNKTYLGRVGYEVYTPFKAIGLDQIILVDRGFIPLKSSRDILPMIEPILHVSMITGLLNKPPSYISLGQMIEPPIRWPLRVQYIELESLHHYLKQPLFPAILQLKSNHPAAFEMEWQIIPMTPEKHRAYALQWFALALGLLILSLALLYSSKG